MAGTPLLTSTRRRRASANRYGASICRWCSRIHKQGGDAVHLPAGGWLLNFHREGAKVARISMRSLFFPRVLCVFAVRLDLAQTVFSRVGTLLIKELIQFRRDWVLLVFILLAPALQLVLMAQAIARGVVEQPTAVLDLDRSPLSRQLIVDLDNSETLRIKRYLISTDEMRELLDRGVIRLAVIIPAGFAAGLSRGDFPQEVQVIADGSNAVSASISIGSVADVVNRFSADLIAGYGLVVPEFVDFRTDIRFNPTLDFRDFSLPAQLGFVVYQVTLAVASLGLARERELGTLEQLMVTPLRQSELTLGK
ncbi:MAG TPA: ABC transporter permease, partial [Anaerolineae bacterium]|nr:ABC transporter permease [Anaerolineae bacterium]